MDEPCNHVYSQILPQHALASVRELSRIYTYHYYESSATRGAVWEGAKIAEKEDGSFSF